MFVCNLCICTRPVEYEGPYAAINDSASMVSRDRRSRVRRHYGHDSDSEASGVTGRSGRPPHMPPGGWYPGSYEPMMFRRRGPRSVASSKQSSKDESHHSGKHTMLKKALHVQRRKLYPRHSIHCYYERYFPQSVTYHTNFKNLV